MPGKLRTRVALDNKVPGRPDYILIITVALLIILGILILTSVSSSFSQEKVGNPYYFLNHQFFFGLIPGLILAFLFFRIRLEFLKKWVPLLLLINLILAAMVFLPQFGQSFGGATRWLSFGPITFQPSEFLKLTFILYLASWLASRMSVAKNLTEKNSQSLIVFLIALSFVSVLLIFQPDASTLGIIVLTSALIYFLAGAPFWHIMLLFSAGFGLFFALIMLAPYRMKRLISFVNPEIDPLGMSYQIKQAMIAVGSGGIFGLGLGMSRQKFGFLPQPLSDSIFAVFSEETGFLGAVILISLFLLFLWRGFKIAQETQNQFLRLTALGISLWISLQAFVNIGSMLGILPLTGIPLPFISYGGSHLITELIAVGILLNISRK